MHVSVRDEVRGFFFRVFLTSGLLKAIKNYFNSPPGLIPFRFDEAKLILSRFLRSSGQHENYLRLSSKTIIYRRFADLVVSLEIFFSAFLAGIGGERSRG